jgi:D-arabinose 1-dehydrogenase-like Zn-dependent alcohol dehydrogenase
MSEKPPKSYKAVVLDRPKAAFYMKEMPVKIPQEGEILIKSLACSMCHSVRQMYTISWLTQC